MIFPKCSLSQKTAFIFDYGGTLVQYYEREEFPQILQKALTNVYTFLVDSEFSLHSFEHIWHRAQQENYESKDYRVRPLGERLLRIFNLRNPSENLVQTMIELFMEPIFSVAEIYADTLPTLKRLKKEFGRKNIILSNTAWGSPSSIWLSELQRFSLDPGMNYIDLVMFCYDIGWRKPSPMIFQKLLESMNLHPSECVMIGDNPIWDIQGAKNLQIDAILIDRNNKYPKFTSPKIHDLEELFELI